MQNSITYHDVQGIFSNLGSKTVENMGDSHVS